MKKLTIIDTDCANLSSVKFAFDRLGIQAEISREFGKINCKIQVGGVSAPAGRGRFVGGGGWY